MRVPQLIINDKQELVEMVKGVCIALSWSGKAPRETVSLLMETAAAESAFMLRRQTGGGPARGLWQVEPATADDIFQNYMPHRPQIIRIVSQLSFGFTLFEPLIVTRGELSDLLEHNDVFCCCLARIVYLRDPDPIPHTVEERAAYWKRVYNTPLGKGTVAHYMATAWGVGEV